MRRDSFLDRPFDLQICVRFLGALGSAALADNSDDNNRHSIVNIRATAP
jgi:hypothetical protein